MVFAAHRAGNGIARDSRRFKQALHGLCIPAADGKPVAQRAVGGLRVIRHIDAVRVIPLVIPHVLGHIGVQRFGLLGQGHIRRNGLFYHLIG